MGRTLAVAGAVALALAAAVGIVVNVMDRRSRSAVRTAGAPITLDA
jgi:hypothetical protein